MKCLLLSWTLVILIILLPYHHKLPGVKSFNLEPRLPVIKKGDTESYFGFSVAQHLTSAKQPWILVGAPLGQNLQPNTTRSGALFKCPLTLVEGECSQVVTDGKRNPRSKSYDPTIGSDNLYQPSSDEYKDGQWLGVNVRSQGKGGKVMVCAHRYIHQGPDFRWGLGLCHFLDENLAYSQTLEPCRNKQRQGLEDFGFCQVGTSGYLLEDDTALMGAPGAYTCRGTIYGISVSDDYLNKDRQHYHSPFGARSPVDKYSVDKYSYLGMSVTGGKFFGPNKYSYATGAPKAANGSGQVLFFSKNSSEVLQPEGVLTGESFASSYGYELAAMDLNGDNRTDLAVGAPFYMDPKVGGDGGAVYVYLNDGTGFSDTTPFVKLTGPPESRFGFALSSLGDLNHDGFEDLAVGAPYEDGGHGTVYIYLGSAKGIVTEPSQVIRALKFFPDVMTFGYSLSGGVDLDTNSYPDLLVGAYESSTVILLRSRPIIDISTEVSGNLTGIDPSRDGCPDDPDAPTVCFQLLTCFEIRDAAKVDVVSLGVNYTLEAKAEPGKKYSRVYFQNGLENLNHTVQKLIYVRQNAVGMHCEKEVAYLKKPMKDIQTPISFLMTFTLVQREPRYIPNMPLPSIQNYPILNQQEAVKQFQAFFEKDCGKDDLCRSDLFVLATTDLDEDDTGRYVLVLGKQKEFILNITIRNLDEPAYEAKLFIEHPKSMPFIAQIQNATNFDCSKFNTTVIACRIITNPYKQKDFDDVLAVRFDASSLKEIETRLDFNVWANSTSIEFEEKNNYNSVIVTAVKVAELKLQWLPTPKEVMYSSGPVKMDRGVVHNLSDIGSRVMHTYEVINEGPSRASLFNLEIRWPHRVGNNDSVGEAKWLLYLERVEISRDADGECIVPPGVENVLNLPGDDINQTLAESHQEVAESLRRRRVKRHSSSEALVAPEIVIDSSGRRKKIVKMDCLTGSAICVTIVCVIRSLPPLVSAHINLHSRLWNSTLVEDYPGVDAVHIFSRAELRIPDENRQDPVNDVGNALTIALPDLKLKVEAEGVSWLIYLLAGILGILVLLLIIFCLYRWGFFVRRRPQPTHTASILKS